MHFICIGLKDSEISVFLADHQRRNFSRSFSAGNPMDPHGVVGPHRNMSYMSPSNSSSENGKLEMHYNLIKKKGFTLCLLLLLALNRRGDCVFNSFESMDLLSS